MDTEGTNGLNFLSASDSRIPFQDTGGPGFDGQTESIVQLKYPNRDSSIPIATGIEARLIEAEAALQNNDLTTFRAKLNAARAQFTGVNPLPADSVTSATPAQRVDLLFRERAFDLWLTSHRLGDMRRLIRQYQRGSETVFPTGRYKDGTPYGPDVNFPVPEAEQNNPKFHGCLDRNA